MKNLILLLSIFFITSCQMSKKNQEPSNSTETVEMKTETPVALGTIVDVAVSNSDFSTLVVALKAANLVEALQADGPFTVFAPTNEAFGKIDEKTLASLLEEKNQQALANILTYHVVQGKLTATDVVSALESGNGSVDLTALNGQVINVMQKDGKIWLKDLNGNYSEIIATDVMGSNGVIHVINTWRGMFFI